MSEITGFYPFGRENGLRSWFTRVQYPVNSGEKSFGETLRASRLNARRGLREFARMTGISPTYLSQIETGQTRPTEKRVRTMAVLLGKDEDAWVMLAGMVPESLRLIIAERPIEISALIRAAKGVDAKVLRDAIERRTGGGGGGVR